MISIDDLKKGEFYFYKGKKVTFLMKDPYASIKHPSFIFKGKRGEWKLSLNQVTKYVYLDPSPRQITIWDELNRQKLERLGLG